MGKIRVLLWGPEDIRCAPTHTPRSAFTGQRDGLNFLHGQHREDFGALLNLNRKKY